MYLCDTWDSTLRSCSLQVRKDGTVGWLRPDGKTQVTVEYKKEGGAMIPIRVHTILISTQHDEDVTNEQIHKDLMEHVIKPVRLPTALLSYDPAVSAFQQLLHKRQVAGALTRHIPAARFEPAILLMKQLRACVDSCIADWSRLTALDECVVEPLKQTAGLLQDCLTSGAPDLVTFSSDCTCSLRQVVPEKYLDEKTIFHLNPSGRFVIGGPHGDAGLTGRKIIIDTYGGWGAHGGGAFSGKDPTKVRLLPTQDGSPALMPTCFPTFPTLCAAAQSGSKNS